MDEKIKKQLSKFYLVMSWPTDFSLITKNRKKAEQFMKEYSEQFSALRFRVRTLDELEDLLFEAYSHGVNSVDQE